MGKGTLYIVAIFAFVCCAGQRSSFACLNSVDKYVSTGCGDSDCTIQTCNDGFVMNLDKTFPHHSEQLAVSILPWPNAHSFVDPNNLERVRVRSDIMRNQRPKQKKQLNSQLVVGRVK